MTLYTVGHSSLTMERFVGLLTGHGIEHVVDVRRSPMSRRHPQFSREFLKRVLGEHGIAYTWLEPLGGRREYRSSTPHTAWRIEGFSAFADHMETSHFEKAMAEVQAIAATGRVALMCAEARVDRCHRRLIADWLHVRGARVLHIVSGTEATPHALSDVARIEGTRIVYDRGQLEL